MAGREESIPQVRIIALSVIMASVVIVYGLVLFSMQIVDGYIYVRRAEEVTRRSEVLPAYRGEIYDASYDVPIVTNVDSFAVRLNPADVPSDRFLEIAAQLEDMLRLPIGEIGRMVPPSQRRSHTEVELATSVDYRTIVQLAEQADRLPGVSWISKPTRRYTLNESMSHVLGYVGDITNQELQVLFNRGYTRDSLIGKAGIELEYDEILRGTPGRRFRSVDAQGRYIGDAALEDVAPQPGHDVVLTLDRRIQELAEDALGERTGAVVVLRPANGEIVALASYPRFDPNIFSTGTGAQAFRQLSLDRRSPFLNRTLQTSAPPASTFKIIMTAAVLQEQVFGLDDEIYSRPYFELGDRRFRDWRPNGFGWIGLLDGLAWSSNVFFYTMGHDYLGIEHITEYGRLFGLGQRTGIDLPGEVSGIMPSPEWKRRELNSPWVGGDTVNSSIGQGYTAVTPLQLANVMAMVANEGTVYRPHVVREIRDSVSGRVIEQVQPQIYLNAELDQRTWENLQLGLRMVVSEGTAHTIITTPVVNSAGKTGTGETSFEEENHSWFVAYAPYEADDPRERLVVVVFVDGQDDFEWWAPKAANLVLHGAFTGQNFEQTVSSLRRAPRPLWYM